MTADRLASLRGVARTWWTASRPAADSYRVVVRAVEGTGRVQPREASAAFPSGATGWVSRTVRP